MKIPDIHRHIDAIQRTVGLPDTVQPGQAQGRHGGGAVYGHFGGGIGTLDDLVDIVIDAGVAFRGGVVFAAAVFGLVADQPGGAGVAADGLLQIGAGGRIACGLKSRIEFVDVDHRQVVDAAGMRRIGAGPPVQIGAAIERRDIERADAAILAASHGVGEALLPRWIEAGAGGRFFCCVGDRGEGQGDKEGDEQPQSRRSLADRHRGRILLALESKRSQYTKAQRKSRYDFLLISRNDASDITSRKSASFVDNLCDTAPERRLPNKKAGCLL
jgi:hypothetical protein